MNKIKLLNGDCREHLKEFEENSIDAVITDPPYGLEFMGKEWDKLSGYNVHDKYKSKFKSERTSGGSFENRIGSKWGAPKKNPRCMKCGHYRHSGTPCNCEEPDWDSREYLFARQIQQWHQEWALDCYRVLKSGGHLLVFGGTRTYHRMACAVEDAGFEIRDCITWIYGSGFPKSLDISKAIDKMYGEEREVVGKRNRYIDGSVRKVQTGLKPDSDIYGDGLTDSIENITTPSSLDAQTWNGWGTALKPAVELILVARKPISEKNISLNILKHSVGGLNIKETRIPHSGDLPEFEEKAKESILCYGDGLSGSKRTGEINQKGRFPSNLILDEYSSKLLDVQSGVSKSSGGGQHLDSGNIHSWYKNAYERTKEIGFKDVGGASRFFYVAKASSSERFFICKVCDKVDNNRKKHLKHSMRCNDCNVDYEPEFKEVKDSAWEGRFVGQNPRVGHYQDDHKHHNTESNLIGHPTQKPVKLIEYLIKLVTRENQIVLDPFVGSGTTAVACIRLNRKGIGIDNEKDYIRIAQTRIENEPLYKIKTLNQFT